jgi:hypothetical protein
LGESICAITIHLPLDYNNGAKCCQFWFWARGEARKCLLALFGSFKYLYAAYRAGEGMNTAESVHKSDDIFADKWLKSASKTQARRIRFKTEIFNVRPCRWQP